MKKSKLTISLILLLAIAMPVSAQVLDDFLSEVQDLKGTAPKIKTEILTFTGSLINHGPYFNKERDDLSGATNVRWFKNGIGTRNGIEGYTSNSVPSGTGDITNVFALNFQNQPEVWAVTRQTTGTSIWPIQTGGFSSVSDWETSGLTTDAKLSHSFVRDTFIMTDGDAVYMYAGVSVEPTALLQEVSGASTQYINRYDWIKSGDSNHFASGTTFLIGYSRPFVGIMMDENESSMDTGIVSSTTEYLYGGKMRYWAVVNCDSGGSFVSKPKIQTDLRELGTAWDGKSEQYSDAFIVNLSGTSEVQDWSYAVRDESTENYADISQLESGGTIEMGFLYKPRLVHIYLPEDFKNETVSSISAYYYNGNSFVVAPAFTDGTSDNSIALGRSGILDFDKITDWKTKKIGELSVDFYSLVIKVSTTISDYVRIYKVVAIPDYDSPSSVGAFSMTAQGYNRHFLANGRDLSKVIVSALNQPDCFIGPDSRDEEDNPLYVGKKEKMIWMGPAGSNYFVFMKKTQNFIMDGNTPATFNVRELVGTRPAVSQESVVSIEKGTNISIFYMSNDGIYDLFDPKEPISEDIRAYWEPGNDLKIAASDLDDVIGKYDPVYDEATWLLPDGKELVYNLKFKKWSVNDRNSAIAMTTTAVLSDTNNNHLNLGGSGNGYVYYMEQGSNDDGYTIYTEVERPFLSLGSRVGRSELRKMALRYELPDGSSMSGGSLYITPSLSDNATEYTLKFDLDEDVDEGFKVFSFNGLVNARKGYNHKFKFRFPGRINLFMQALKSREAFTNIWDDQE